MPKQTPFFYISKSSNLVFKSTHNMDKQTVELFILNIQSDNQQFRRKGRIHSFFIENVVIFLVK